MSDYIIQHARRHGKTDLINQCIAEAERKGYKVLRVNPVHSSNEDDRVLTVNINLTEPDPFTKYYFLQMHTIKEQPSPLFMGATI